MAGVAAARRGRPRRRPRPASYRSPLGQPVIDPTQNVLDLVEAAIQRQDDLREAESRHVREIAALRAEYAAELRHIETDRLNAIRAVDVGAVNRAAEVAAQQATFLAAQVAQSAETLRTQVAATATAGAAALTDALDPIKKDIADLRRVQYEAVGGKQNVVEARDVRVEKQGNINLGLSILGAAIMLLSLILALKL